MFGRVAVVEPLGFGPDEKVGRGGGFDAAHAVGRAAAEVAEVGAVLAAVVVIKGQIQGIEVAFGDDGIRDIFVFSPHEREVEAVRGLEGVEGARCFAGDDGLVLGSLLAGRVGVGKDGGVAGAEFDAGEAVGREDDVVVAVALELDQAEGWFVPAFAVAAFGIADEVGVGVVHLAAGHVVVPGAVVHADAPVLVLEDGAVEAGVAFAGRVRLQDDFAFDGWMEAQVESIAQFGNEEVVDQGFKARADVDGLGVCGGGVAHELHLWTVVISGQWRRFLGQRFGARRIVLVDGWVQIS